MENPKEKPLEIKKRYVEPHPEYCLEWEIDRMNEISPHIGGIGKVCSLERLDVIKDSQGVIFKEIRFQGVHVKTEEEYIRLAGKTKRKLTYTFASFDENLGAVVFYYSNSPTDNGRYSFRVERFTGRFGIQEEKNYLWLLKKSGLIYETPCLDLESKLKKERERITSILRKALEAKSICKESLAVRKEEQEKQIWESIIGPS